MSDILTADDPLYAELYDVKAEAMAFRNYIDFDPSERIAALRAKAPVHAAPLRDLLGLPEHKRHALAEGKPKFCALSFAACEAVLRDHKTFSSTIVHHPNPRDEKTMGVLEMDGGEHRAYRRALQPIFLKHQTEGWWRTQWIDAAVETLVAQLKTRERAELNLDFCARIPVHTITTAIGMNGDEALEIPDGVDQERRRGPRATCRATGCRIRGGNIAPRSGRQTPRRACRRCDHQADRIRTGIARRGTASAQ